ncbi:MAG: hypothetical protein ACR2H2_00795 [Solirubrobacteraceae bacterium]
MRAIAEVLADVLEARGVVAAPVDGPHRVLDAVQVGRLLGRDRRWVYAHAEELGGFRYANGPRARIGFDLEVVERWMRERRISEVKSRRPRRGRPPKALANASLIAFEP